MNCLGKTIFLLYLLFKRILQKKRTLLHISKDQFIGFSDDGVCLHSKEDPAMDINWDYPLGTWTLVDSYSKAYKMVGPLLEDYNLFVIFTTSPEISRYHGWSERTDSPLYAMDPTSEEELQAYR
jgi:hypothetical protein